MTTDSGFDAPKALQARFGDGAPDLPAGVFTPQMAAILSRRTVRRYTDQVPAEPLLQALCAVSLCASSKSDFQQAAILRVQDTDIRAQIGQLFPAMPWIVQAPVFYVFLGDARRLERMGTQHAIAVDNGALEGFFNASVDAALALQTFVLAAESAGLGCCPISVIRNRIEAVAPLLGLPDKVFPVAGLCVGYPDGLAKLSPRLPLAVTLHTDRYDDSALPEGVAAYDHMRDARFPLPAAQQRGNDRHGVADFYGWSQDKVRAAAEAEGAAFPVYLREHGFGF
jgi:nitroreductase